MRYEERDDGELIELAQAGWAPAFAVLIHRHGPALLTAFADDPDPLDRVEDVLVRAMRQLPDRDPEEPVAPWLFALAGRPEPADVPPVEADELDQLWREVAVLWPDGRHARRRRPRPVLWTAVSVLGAVALGVAVPTIVLGIPAAPDHEPPPSVRAQPLEEEEPEPAEPEDLPEFEFPDLGDTQAPPTIETPADPVGPPSAPTGPATTPTVPTTPPTNDTTDPLPEQPTTPDPGVGDDDADRTTDGAGDGTDGAGDGGTDGNVGGGGGGTGGGGTGGGGGDGTDGGGGGTGDGGVDAGAADGTGGAAVQAVTTNGAR